MPNIRDIMTPDPAVCTPDTSLEEIARMMVDFDCGAIPVVESDDTPRPVGVVTDRDVVCRLIAQGRNPLECDAADCMTTPCITVNVNGSFDDCRRRMADNQIRRIVVVDDQNFVCGVLSLADLVQEGGAEQVVREVSEPTEEPSRVEADVQGKKEFEPA